MDPTQAIVLKTFLNTTAADFAASQLRSQGIECWITSDDCGGMYPPLGAFKLLVNSADADDAREFLEQAHAPQESPADAQEQSANATGDSAPPPRVFRFNSGLIIGLIVGALLHFSYTQYQQHRDRTVEYDNDNDGSPDEEVVWRNGEFVEMRFDRNRDGRWDYWIFYRDNVPSREEADDNFDGRVDAWDTYSPRGFRSQTEVDSDYNGIRDMIMTYTNGVPAQIDWRPNGTNVIVLRQFYRLGVLREELRDVNGDGRFDVSIAYDAFNTPIGTNHLQPFLRLLP